MPTMTLPLLPSTTRPVEIKSWYIFLSFEWPYIAVLIILMGCCFVDLNQNFHPWFFFRWLNYLRQQIQNNVIFSFASYTENCHFCYPRTTSQMTDTGSLRSVCWSFKALQFIRIPGEYTPPSWAVFSLQKDSGRLVSPSKNYWKDRSLSYSPTNIVSVINHCGWMQPYVL